MCDSELKNTWITLPKPVRVGPIFDYQGNCTKDSLHERGLIQPGTIVCLESGLQYLIGNQADFAEQYEQPKGLERGAWVVAYYKIDVSDITYRQAAN